jgi:BON domain-containing protein
MRVRFLFRSVIVTATLAFFGGCASSSTDKPTAAEPQPEMRAMGQPVAPPTPPSASGTQTSEEPTDETIGFQIRRLLNTDPTTGAGIFVVVDDGNVTLRGTAVTPAGSWRAEGLARSVKGVKSVVNQISVNTPSVTQ